jgi:uncharacterized peroxidase-related enzyme
MGIVKQSYVKQFIKQKNKKQTMNRIQQIDPAQATGKTKQLFGAVQTKLGIVPNAFRVLGNSPASLEGYLNFSGALANGVLTAQVREQIALTVAEANLCNYCLSAHSYVGGKLGLSDGELRDARNAGSEVAKTNAVLKLARAVVLQRGEISEAEFAEARAAGLGDAEIVETVANVAVNIFTNYINHVAKTVVDFPEVKAGVAAANDDADGACCGRH